MESNQTSDGKPLVSVVVPIFNADKFLTCTIQSVKKQTYNHWELILVDDGSTDNSADIARFFADSHPERIRFYQHPGRDNKGSSATRNTGIRNARGEFVAFLDADDKWAPDYLSNQVDKITTTNAKMVCEASVYWYSWEDQLKKDKVIPVGATPDRLYSPGELNLILYPLKKGAAPCMNAIIVTKNVLLKHGGFEESFPGMYDDQVFLSKMYYNEHVYISSSNNNYYRIRKDSLMSTVDDPMEYIRYRRLFLTWFKNYLESLDAANTNIHSLTKRLLFKYNYPFLNYFLYKIPTKVRNKIVQFFYN